MPLQKQKIEIPLGGGLQTKADPKVVPPGSLLVLENGEFDDAGALKKRNGYDALSTATINGSAITKGRGLHTYRGSLVHLDGLLLREYLPSQHKWQGAQKLRLCATTATGLPVAQAPYVVSTIRPIMPEIAVANGVAVYAYRPFGGTLVFGAIDASTGADIIPASFENATSCAAIRVIASGSTIFIISIDGANVLMRYLNTESPTAFSVASNLATDSNGTDIGFDAAAVDQSGNCVVAYETTTPRVKLLLFTTAGGGASTTISEDPDTKHVGVCVSAAGDIYVAYRNQATNRARTRGYTSGLVALFAAADLDTSAGCDQFAGVEESANTIRWVYSVSASSQRRVKHNTVTSAGTIGTSATVRRGAFVASKPFRYNDLTWMCLGYTSGNATAIQSGYYLVDVTGSVIVARYLPDQGLTEDKLQTILPQPSPVAEISPGVYWVGAGYRTSQSLILDTYYEQPARVALDFTRPTRATELGGNLLVATGGLLHEYDGDKLYENGFFVAPEPLSAVQVGGGSLADGVYQFAAAYAAFDSRGQLQIGPPSTIGSITVAAGGGTAVVTVTVPYLRMTNRLTGSGLSVYLLLYASEAGGDTLYEVQAADNSTSGDTTTINFATTTGLTDNRILYTNGNILENNAPPALRNIVGKGARVYGMAEKAILNYSKELVDGYPVSFVAETMVKRLHQDGGEHYSLAVMDDTIIAFGENSIQQLGGDGLDDTGASDGLSLPRVIASDTGALPDTPLVTTDAGVFFRSRRGQCLLNRALQVEYIGAPVEAYNANSLVSSALVPGKGQVRFGHADGSALVYDQSAGQWASFSDHAQVAAAVCDGVYYWQAGNGRVYRMSSGFRDHGSWFDLLVETPWLKVDGLQGFQRLYHFGILGEWRSPHRLVIDIYYDYRPDSAETITFDALSGYAAGDPLQMRRHLGVKCQAVKFRIRDTDQRGTGESLKLTALALEVGVKGGIVRKNR
jgi:hypothetical protein